MIATPIAIALCVFSVSEVPAQRIARKSSEPWLRVLKSNKSLQYLLSADFLLGLMQGLFFGLTIFYTADVLHLPNVSGPFLLLMLAVGLPAIILWSALSKRYDKHKVLAYAAITGAVMALSLLFVPPNHMVLGVLAFSLQGLGLGAALYLTKSIMADVADEDRVLCGRDRTGYKFRACR